VLINNQCNPGKNCEFRGKYKVWSASGQLHDNASPCNWSVNSGTFDTIDVISQAWLGVCSGSVYPCSFMISKNSGGNCGQGVVIFEVQFAGKCMLCPAGTEG